MSNQSEYHKKCVDFTSEGSVLGVTNGGGGGHKTVLQALNHIFEMQNSATENKFYTVDIIKNSFPKPLGKFIYNMMNQGWNNAKKNGDIGKQEFLVKGRPFRNFLFKGPTHLELVDVLFFIPIFFSIFTALMRKKSVTCVLDVQPLATSVIMKAVRAVNAVSGRKIKVYKMLTDLPTSDAIHYSEPLKNLSKKNKKNLQVITTRPLIENNMNEQEWWKHQFNLYYNPDEPSLVKYSDFPLRPAFFNLQNSSCNRIQIKINNEEEFRFHEELMQKKLQKISCFGGLFPYAPKKVIHIPVNDKDCIVFSTIGSETAYKTLDYLSDFIEIAIDACNRELSHRFIFFAGCGRHEAKKIDLFYRVCRIAKEIPEEYKKNILIIPLGFQDDDEIAPLMQRCNLGIYGGGGVTIMETIHAAKGAVFIHSEKELCDKERNRHESDAELLKGFALWEKGNVRYRMEKGAAPIAPGILFKKALKEAIERIVAYALS